MTDWKNEIKVKLVAPLRTFYREQQARMQFKRSLRPSDIFIVGHPKSGNTWITMMLASIIERNFSNEANLSNLQEFVPAFHARDLEIARYSDYPSPRIFRNEGPVYPELYPKTVYIVRDPRAVYVSYYHHYLHDTSDHGRSLADFVDEMLTYGCIRKLEPYLIRWDRQVEQWRRRSQTQPVTVIRYEDMKLDRHKVLKEVLDFAGILCDAEAIERAVQRGSFDSMRKEEVTFGAEPYSGTKGERGFFVRKGKVDGWKEEMPPEVAARIEREFSRVMEQEGYL